MDPEALAFSPFKLSYLEVDFVSRIQKTWALFQMISGDKFGMSMPLARVDAYLNGFRGLPQVDKERMMLLLSTEERVDRYNTFAHFFLIAPLLRDVVLPHASSPVPLPFEFK